MTISTATSTASYTGNASTQIFPIPFYFLVDGDIKVSQKVAATGVISVLTLGTDYTLSGAGNQAGGSATLVTAPASGDQLFIERNVSAVQETAYPVNSPFPSASHEKALDRLTMLVQQLQTADEFTLTRDPLADFFDVGGNRLTDIADAVDPNDAVSLQQQTQAIAAAQLTPSVPSDDIALLSNLASTAAGKGAALIGYLTGTVKSFLDSLATDVGAAVIKYKASFTGAIQRTLGAVAEDQVNSEWFSPDRTGVNDASAALQLALNAAVGRTLVIRPGTYKISAALKVGSNTTIYAYGCTFNRGASIDNMLRNDSAGTTGGFGANANIAIFGGTWDAKYSTFTGSNCTVMGFGHCTNVTVRDATLQNTTGWHYIEFNSSKDCLVDNCVFSGGAEQVLGTMEAVQIDSASSSAAWPWFGPYDDTPCQKITVRNSRFDNCGSGVGTHTDPGSAHLDIKLLGNTFNNPVYAGIRGQGWSGVKVHGNRFNGGYYGVWANPAASYLISDWSIVDNTIYNIGNTAWGGATGKAILLDGGASYHVRRSTIRGNTVQDCTGTGSDHGVSMNYATQITVCDNVIDGTNGNGLYLFSGSYITVSGNTIINAASIDLAFGNGSANTPSYSSAVGNTCKKGRVVNCDNVLFTKNTFVTSLTNSGNTNSSATSNLIAGTLV